MRQVSNTLILGLGPVGYWIAEAYQKQLRVRHPNQSLPTIEILALLKEEPSEEFTLSTLNIQAKEEHDLANLLSSLYPQQVIPGADASDLLENLDAHHPRLLGQVSLHQHIYAIEQALQEIHHKISSVETINPNQTHVFVLLSLADSFMSGLMPDLAYVIQNSLKAGASHQSFIHIHPILLMPGFEGEIELNTDDPRQKAEAESRINASAAACLKEMDYYFAQGYSYYHHFTPGITIDAPHSPLGNGQIYLLEPANEKQHRLRSVDDIKQMVATWLYHVTLTPLRDLLDPPTTIPGAIYGSFGDATLSVPISHWIERATVQLQLDLLKELYPSEKPTTQLDITSTRARLHLTEQEIRHKLTDATGYKQITMPSSSAIPLQDAYRFLRKVQTDYTGIMHEKMPTVKEHIFTQMHAQMSEDHQEQKSRTIDKLKDHVRHLLDESRGGLKQTADFLEGLHDALQQEEQELTLKKEQLERDGRENLKRSIEKQRYTYFNRAQVVTTIPSISFPPALALIGVGQLPMIALSWHFYQNNGLIYAAAMFVLGTCLAIFVWIWIRSTLHTSRSQVIQRYEERLQAFRKADLLSATLRLYKEIIEWIADIRKGAGTLPQKLVRIRTQLHEHQQEKQLGDATRFSGLAMGRVSDSLLTPQLMTEFEQKARTAGLEGEIKAMNQEIGTPSQWIQEEWQEQKLANNLKKFAHQRVSQQLGQYDLDQLLKLIPQAELEDKITRMVQVSQPYWQHNTGQIPPHQVVALANPESHRQLLEQLLLGIQILPIENVYELAITTVRHGFTLPQSNTFSDVLMKHYEHLTRTEPDASHTRPDRRILPTRPEYASGISLLNHSVRHLCAVAFGIKIIFEDLDDFYWEDESMQKYKLNGTLTDVLLKMEHDHDLQAAIRATTLQQYDAKTSPSKLQKLINSLDFDKPLYPIWVILAIQDFLQYES